MSQELSNLRSSWQTDINAGTATTQKLIEGFFASLTKNITDLDNKIERTKQETKENRENLNRNERAIFQQGDANLRITETLNRIEDRLKSTFEQTFVRNHAIDEKLETFTDDIEAINILTARMRADIAKSEDYGARIEARFLAMEQSAMKWKDRAKKVLKYGVVSLLGTGGIGALAGEVIRLLEW